MDSSAPADVTKLLIVWSDGDEAARERLMSVVYEELHRLAREDLNVHSDATRVDSHGPNLDLYSGEIMKASTI
jgi:hypothetical protein